MVKNLPAMQETWVWSLRQEDPLRGEWLPTSILLPREFHGQRSLVGYRIYTYVFYSQILFLVIGYYKISNILLCALQSDLVGYLFCIQWCVYVNPKPLICRCLTPFPFGNCKFVFCLWLCFRFVDKFVRLYLF